MSELNDIESIIEGLLFAWGDKLSTEKIASVLDLGKNEVKDIIAQMTEKYNNSNRGFTIREINGHYQLCSKIQHYDYIKKLFEPRQKQVLSQAAYETLAIIAYNRPITKAGIEEIRGVNSDRAISKLIEKGLIREAGRLDSPGKPILYEPTDEFLKCFGYSSLEDLPELKDT